MRGALLLGGLLLVRGCDPSSGSSGGSGAGSGSGAGAGPGGSGVEGVVQGAPVAEDQFVETLAEKVCSAAAGCCSNLGVQFDKNRCMASAQASLYKTVDKEKQRGRTYNPQIGGTCIATLAAQYAKCTLRVTSSASEAACDDLFRGTTSEGGRCSSSNDCAAGLSCISKPTGEFPGATTSACGVPRQAQAGEACGSTASGAGAICVEGTMCDPQSNKCMALPKPGEACLSSRCNADGYCDPGGGMPVCRARAKIGASCGLPPGSAGAVGGPYPVECVSEAICLDGVCAGRGQPIDAKSCAEVDFG